MNSGGAVSLTLGLVVAAPLLYAAASKLLDPARFALAIPRFGLTFLAAVPTSARLVGLLEFAAAFALVVFPVGLTAGAAGILYLALALVLLRARLRGASGDCGCFGAMTSGIDGASVARNLVLTASCLSLAYLRGQGQLGSYEPRIGVAVVITFTLGAAAIDTYLDIRRRAA